MPAHPLMRWIKNLVKNRGTVSRRDGRQRSEAVRRAPARRWRPAIEFLEDRTTPTLGLTTSTQVVVASDYNTGAVYEFDSQTGALLQTLVPPQYSGEQPGNPTGLVNPTGMAVGPDGNLYFSSISNNSIFEYNLSTSSLSTFIPTSVLNGLTPIDDYSHTPPGELLTFGPDGNLYLDFDSNSPSGGEVVRLGIANSSGQLSFNNTETIIATGLTQPTGMTFGIGGDQDSLYVSDSGAGTVVKIASATGGSPSSSTFIAAGSGGLDDPYGLTWGPDGDLYVTDFGPTPPYSGQVFGPTPPPSGQVLVYAATGSFDKVFAPPASSLSAQYPTGEVFLPNGNLLTADLGAPLPLPSEDETLLIPSGPNGAISEFDSNGTFESAFSADAFPAYRQSGDTFFFPTQLVLVTVASPSGSTVSLSPGTVNGTYDQTITPTGGTGTVALTVSNVSNPIGGLTLPTSGTNGLAITGTPMAPGTETFTVTATDSSGATATINYSITANYSPAVSAAFGPSGVVVEVVDSSGVLTQYDATGAHVLSGGVMDASVAFGPSGEVLLVTYRTGVLVLYDATGAHTLAGGVRSATVAFGPSGAVFEVVDSTGVLTQYDATGAHVLSGGVMSASVAFGPSGEVLFVIYQGGSLVTYDATGAHTLASGVASADVAFGPSIEALYVVYGDDYLTEYDALGTHPLGVA